MELRHQHKNERDVSAESDRKKDEPEVRPQWPGKKTLTGSQQVDTRAPDLSRIRSAIGALRSGGTPLPGAMTREYSQLLGLDLSDVRIHHGGVAGAAAKALEATAFTHGTNIAVADHLDLDSAFGRHVIAHELVHVAQNKRSGAPMDLAAHMEVGPSGSAIEQEAERGAAALTRGMSFTVSAHSKLPGISRFGNDENPPTGAAVPVPVPGANPPPVAAPVHGAVPSPTSQPTQAQPAATPPPPPPNPQAQPAPQPRPTTQPTATPNAPATPTVGAPGHNAPSGSASAPNPTTPANREPRPSATPVPQPAPTPAISLDARVQEELEKRADPTLKAGYAKAIAGVDSLRIQALQYTFTPNGIWNTLVETFTAKNAFQDHFGQIYSTNAYRGGKSWADTAQSWIEGLRGVVHIIGDVASVISAWAGLAALVTGALALILSETVIGGIALGAIAAIAAEVALVAGAIKLLTDIIDTLLGIIQMIILIVRARNSKDPAARARFAALLHKEANDFGANVVSIGVQVAVMAVSAGVGAGLSRGANSFMSAFKTEFSKMITPALKPWTLGNNFRAIANMARPVGTGLGVATKGKSIFGNSTNRTVLNVEVEQNLLGISRLQRNALGRVTSTREIVPFTGANQMRGARLVTMRAAVGRAMAINSAGVKIGLGSSQLQADIKQPRDFQRGGTASSSPAGGGGRVNAPASAGADLSKLQMWPSQITEFQTAKGPIQGAVDRTQRQYEMAETQAGPELAAQVRTAFQGANSSTGQMRFGAMQVQTDATEGQANTQRGLQQTTQARQGQDRMGTTQNTANASVQRISGEGAKLQSPPPKEGVLGWLYNQTIGRIGSWIGSAQKWVMNMVGKWAMSLGGFSKEEMDIAGIENDMREDDKKDANSSQEAQDTALKADQIQQTVFQLQENKTRDEQYAIQGMADAQRFIMALEDADRQLAAAVTNGQSYVQQVTPIIQHELQTEEGQSAIDAAYVAPVAAAATAFSDSLDASNVSARAQQSGTAAINTAKGSFPDLDVGPANAAIATAVSSYDTAFGQLVSSAQGQATAMQTAIQAFIGTQDYDGVHANAAALDALAGDFDRAAQALADQLYRAINSTIDQVNAHIQRAIDEANAVPDDPDEPIDEPAGPPAPPVQRKAISSAPVIAVQRKALKNEDAPQQMQQTAATADQPPAVPTDINNPAPAAAPAAASTGDNANAPQPTASGDAATAAAGGAQVPNAAPNGATSSTPKDGLVGGASNTAEAPASTKAKPPNATPKQMSKPGGADKADGETEDEAAKNVSAASAGSGAGSDGSDNASEDGPAPAALPKKSANSADAGSTEAAAPTSGSTAAGPAATAKKKPEAKPETKPDARETAGAVSTGGSDGGGDAAAPMLSGGGIEEGWDEDARKKKEQGKPEVDETEAAAEANVSDNQKGGGGGDESGVSDSAAQHASTNDDDNDQADENESEQPSMETDSSSSADEPDAQESEPSAAEGHAVQRRGTGEGAASNPVSVATAATEGSGGSLPYLNTIQDAFGHHDVSGVRSHSGSAAQEGAAALGASAFAVGDAVAFASSPDLHTAAHEAAHVVQQRAGLRPSGDIDTGPTDSLEQHADAVADAVVAGRSAQGILDQLIGGTSSGASAGVQRKEEKAGAKEAKTAPKISSEAAVAVEGAAAARTTVGVGEVVNLTSTVSGTWTATGGTASGPENTAFEWTAPGKPGQFVVRVKTKDGESTKEFAVIGPSKVTFTATKTYGPPKDNMLGAGMELDMKLGPANVSFQNLTIREQAGGASGLSGYFATIGGRGEDLGHHPFGTDDKGKDNAPKQTTINADNTANSFDDAHLLDDEAQPWPRPFSVGSMSWQIPYLYTCGEVTDKSFTIVTQTMSIVDSKGTVSISKGAASFSRAPKSPLWQPPKKDDDKKKDAAEPAPSKPSGGSGAAAGAKGSGASGYAVGHAESGYAAGEGEKTKATLGPSKSLVMGDSKTTEAAEIKTTAAVVAPDGPDNRKTVGVGEKIFFTSSAKGNWTATAAGPSGAKSAKSTNKFTWIAPATASTATVTFDQGTGTTQPTDMTVIAPTGVDFWKRTEDQYDAGKQGAGMITSVKFLPFSVSFERTSWKEIPGGPSNMKGFFAGNAPDHKPNKKWLGVDSDNSGPTDHAAYWGISGDGKGGWTPGSFDWEIPNNYKVDGETGAGYEFAKVVQSMSVDAQGTTTVTKGSSNATRAVTVGRTKKKSKAKAKGSSDIEARGRGLGLASETNESETGGGDDDVFGITTAWNELPGLCRSVLAAKDFQTGEARAKALGLSSGMRFVPKGHPLGSQYLAHLLVAFNDFVSGKQPRYDFFALIGWIPQPYSDQVRNAVTKRAVPKPTPPKAPPPTITPGVKKPPPKREPGLSSIKAPKSDLDWLINPDGNTAGGFPAIDKSKPMNRGTGPSGIVPKAKPAADIPTPELDKWIDTIEVMGPTLPGRVGAPMGALKTVLELERNKAKKGEPVSYAKFAPAIGKAALEMIGEVVKMFAANPQLAMQAAEQLAKYAEFLEKGTKVLSAIDLLPKAINGTTLAGTPIDDNARWEAWVDLVGLLPGIGTAVTITKTVFMRIINDIGVPAKDALTGAGLKRLFPGTTPEALKAQIEAMPTEPEVAYGTIEKLWDQTFKATTGFSANFNLADAWRKFLFSRLHNYQTEFAEIQQKRAHADPITLERMADLYKSAAISFINKQVHEAESWDGSLIKR